MIRLLINYVNQWMTILSEAKCKKKIDDEEM